MADRQTLHTDRQTPQMDRHRTDRQTHRRTDRQTPHRWTDRQTPHRLSDILQTDSSHRWTDWQTDRSPKISHRNGKTATMQYAYTVFSIEILITLTNDTNSNQSCRTCRTETLGPGNTCQEGDTLVSNSRIVR